MLSLFSSLIHIYLLFFAICDIRLILLLNIESLNYRLLTCFFCYFSTHIAPYLKAFRYVFNHPTITVPKITVVSVNKIQA